ncbi:malate synthase [Bhargavaea ginsengi]|uniref:malate synthase n=1 Tax=Bhargavaea ginsengi TaxID=426757 RepID=UPI002040342F|nr:malate synthase [Bhargavaea ginsengi]MCM3086975.1 malate synthase [Bhargavaea ginsengi]
MNLLNKKVTHERFGTGKVVNLDDSRIEVDFGTESKKFIFPDVFGKHLVLHDESTAQSLKEMIEEKESERKEEELQKEEEKELHRKKQELRAEHEKLMKNHKLHPQSQMVIWLEPEDQYHAFSKWKVFSGEIKSGKNKGKPNKPIRLHQNSAVLLTARDSDKPEEDRQILGVYMVDEEFIGRQCEDGIVPAHSVYRIRLTEQESSEMPFWKYYSNDKNPDKMTWNTGIYRYFDNSSVAQILRDIIALKSDPEEQELAQQFFDHFCKMNQIMEQELPQPDGPLMRK